MVASVSPRFTIIRSAESCNVRRYTRACPVRPALRMTPAPTDRFIRYDELTALVHAWARERPDLVSVASIGRSHEGRELWLLSITNAKTGPADEKPAYWVDGNIHATEVAASAAALH